jgi:hypothetical protein
MLSQKPQSIEALLKFLIYLVLHKEQVEVGKDKNTDSSKDNRIEKTKQSML